MSTVLAVRRVRCVPCDERAVGSRFRPLDEGSVQHSSLHEKPAI